MKWARFKKVKISHKSRQVMTNSSSKLCDRSKSNRPIQKWLKYRSNNQLQTTANQLLPSPTKFIRTNGWYLLRNTEQCSSRRWESMWKSRRNPWDSKTKKSTISIGLRLKTNWSKKPIAKFLISWKTLSKSAKYILRITFMNSDLICPSLTLKNWNLNTDRCSRKR